MDIKDALKRIKARRIDTLHQVDTYYHCSQGRLKVREINREQYELIFYQRPDISRSRISRYDVLPIQKRQLRLIKDLLQDAFGRRVVVKKIREFWLYKHTRVLLDEVLGLGKFLELETVCKGINVDKAKIEQRTVVDLLKLNNLRKLGKSYADMLIKI